MAQINQEAPTSIAAALAELDQLTSQIQTIDGQLGARKAQVKRGELTPDEFYVWRVKALFSKRLQEERKRVLRTWIRVQRERRAEQEANAMELLSRMSLIVKEVGDLDENEAELLEEAEALLAKEVIR